jgi:hypothetical protein
MKKIILFVLVLSLFNIKGNGGVLNCEEAIGYIPPLNIINSWAPLGGDPGDNAFSGDGLAYPIRAIIMR